jgi:hypothetical protein
MIDEEELKRRIEKRIELWEKYLNEIESIHGMKEEKKIAEELGYGDIDLYSAVYDSCPCLIMDELKWVINIINEIKKENEINV